MTSEDASRQLQRGVLAALMHVVSVRDAGAAPLAIEFSAAREAVDRVLKAASTPDGLRRSFEGWEPVQMLKVMTRHHIAGDRRLLGLPPDQLTSIDESCRAQYRKLVIDAADAALKVQIDTSWYRSRSPDRWQRSALEDIVKVFERRTRPRV